MLCFNFEKLHLSGVGKGIFISSEERCKFILPNVNCIRKSVNQSSRVPCGLHGCWGLGSWGGLPKGQADQNFSSWDLSQHSREWSNPGAASMRQEQSQARKSVHMSGSRSGSQSGLVAWCQVGAWPWYSSSCSSAGPSLRLKVAARVRSSALDETSLQRCLTASPKCH